MAYMYDTTSVFGLVLGPIGFILFLCIMGAWCRAHFCLKKKKQETDLESTLYIVSNEVPPDNRTHMFSVPYSGDTGFAISDLPPPPQYVNEDPTIHPTPEHNANAEFHSTDLSPSQYIEI